jgi:hypothetical protein
MLDRLLAIVLENTLYSTVGAVLLVLLLVSLKSKEFYKGIKMILWLATILWVVSVGYEYNTGESAMSLIEAISGDGGDSKKDTGAFQKYLSSEARDKVERGKE